MTMNKEDNIGRLLQAVYKPAVPRPEFKEKLLKRLHKEMEEGKLLQVKLRAEGESGNHF